MPGGRLVFLTGATGFIGSRVARRLARRGDRLRCYVRPSSDTADLERLGADIAVGDLLDVQTLACELAGAEVAYHLAGALDTGVVDPAAVERVNVGGTRAFLAAIERAGTPRAVYASTTVALGPVTNGEGDESMENRGPYRSTYERTKAEAHRLAVDAQRRGLPLIIVCPAFAYGPGDRGPGGRFIEDLLAGKVPGLLTQSVWWSYVHVDDVADGLVRAGTDGRPGETYILSGEHCALDEFARRVGELAGRRPPRLRFPVPVARRAASVLDLVTRVTGVRFAMNRENVEMAAGWRWLHSHARATAALGWRPRSLDEGLPETVAWHQARLRRRA